MSTTSQGSEQKRGLVGSLLPCGWSCGSQTPLHTLATAQSEKGCVDDSGANRGATAGSGSLWSTW